MTSYQLGRAAAAFAMMMWMAAGYQAWWRGLVDYPARIEWFRPHLDRLCGESVRAVGGRSVRSPEDWYSAWERAKAGDPVAVKCGNGQEVVITASGRVARWWNRIASLAFYALSWFVLLRMRPETGGLPGFLLLAGSCWLAGEKFGWPFVPVFGTGGHMQWGPLLLLQQVAWAPFPVLLVKRLAEQSRWRLRIAMALSAWMALCAWGTWNYLYGQAPQWMESVEFGADLAVRLFFYGLILMRMMDGQNQLES